MIEISYGDAFLYAVALFSMGALFSVIAADISDAVVARDLPPVVQLKRRMPWNGRHDDAGREQ